ncbi:hypothetical protein SAMN05443428_13812 [Caloramator quimbayensis]|uniref:Uncharacterized protein n=1 Tax=Caloramator quimbayensis TaxID=1147123 RepID=A0A1T4YDN0_9CLOT|nr:hypothetical protein [Caloramator quimbayensis]SKA99790.1 hypothetical protein SAMN05443428_13812 [Caloramator quimbayensis]
MKIKTDIEFISFSDGICDIYSIDEEGNITYKFRGLGFANRVLGFKRYFTAAANQVKTDRVIRIPNVYGIDNHDIVEIRGNGKYDIELIQNIFDSNPQCIDLTLRQLEVIR